MRFPLPKWLCFVSSWHETHLPHARWKLFPIHHQSPREGKRLLLFSLLPAPIFIKDPQDIIVARIYKEWERPTAVLSPFCVWIVQVEVGKTQSSGEGCISAACYWTSVDKLPFTLALHPCEALLFLGYWIVVWNQLFIWLHKYDVHP